MLVLERKRDERIVINDEITITVTAIRGDKVRLGIEAPKDMPVHRQEVQDAIRRERGGGEAGRNAASGPDGGRRRPARLVGLAGRRESSWMSANPPVCELCEQGYDPQTEPRLRGLCVTCSRRLNGGSYSSAAVRAEADGMRNGVGLVSDGMKPRPKKRRRKWSLFSC